ncbi:MAG TPA: avidin/streptavidin family protein [Vicinamibacteria bacterium]|jgi:hypothetical protein|nr:avidin/streptavidin family protein [Vicinamibacteria bacterium]
MKHAEFAVVNTKKVAPAAFDFKGHWVNELGSYMDLSINGEDVTGTYVSAVSDAGGPTPPFPLRGTVAGDLISFTVNWEEAITAWVGHGVINNGQPQILTLWHLILTVPNETDPEEQWKTVMAGADEFTR